MSWPEAIVYMSAAVVPSAAIVAIVWIINKHSK